MYCYKCGSEMEIFDDNGVIRHKCIYCGNILYKNPYPCVSILIVNEENRILMGIRGNESIHPDKWCLPCGYIEYNESFLEAAKREVREETGLDIEIKGILNVVSNYFDNNLNTIVIALLARSISSNIFCDDDLKFCKWFSKEQLSDIKFAFSSDEYLVNLWKTDLLKLLPIDKCVFYD